MKLMLFIALIFCLNSATWSQSSQEPIIPAEIYSIDEGQAMFPLEEEVCEELLHTFELH